MPPGLGRAVLELSTESAQFFRDLDKTDVKFNALKNKIRGVSTDVGGASTQLGGFGSALQKTFGPADTLDGQIKSLWTNVKGFAGGLGIGLGITALGGFASKVFSTADNIQDMSQKMGVSAEAAQRFSFAAKQGGADIEDVSRAIVKMNQELAGGDKSTVAALKAAGLSIDELRKKKPEEAFRDIVKAIEQIPNPMQQTQVALQLLGKSGAELLPAIRSGFLDVADSATVMSNETVERLAAAQQAWENFFNNITIWSGEFLADVMGNLSTAMSGFQKFFGDVKATAGGFFSGGFSGAGAAHAAYMEDLKKSQLAEIESKKTSEALKAAKDHLAKSTDFAAGKTGELTEAQKKAKAASDAYRKSVEGLTDELSGAKLAGEVQKVNDAIAKLTAEQKKNPDVVDRMLAKVKALVAAGGLPLLSKEAHELYVRHAALHDIIPKVGLDWDALLPPSRRITLEYKEQTRSLSELLAINQRIRDFGKAFINTGPVDLSGAFAATVPLRPPPSLMASFWTDLKGQATNFGKQLGPTILAAVTGGGDVWRSIGAQGGLLIGTSLASNFGGFLKKNLGAFLGDAIASFLPGVGALLAPLLGKIGAVFKTLGRNIARDMQDAFATTELGFAHLNALMARLREMGPEGQRLAAALDRAQKRDDEGATNKAIEDVRKFMALAEADAVRLGKAIDDAFSRATAAAKDFGGKAPAALRPLLEQLRQAKGLTDEQRASLDALSGSPSWQTLQSMAEGLGIDLSALGPAFNQAKIDDTALGYARTLMTLRDAGADMNGVLAGSKDKLQALADQARKTSSSLPMAIKPFLQSLVDSRQLLGDNGEALENLDSFTFTGTLEDAFKDMKGILEEIRDLLAGGLPKAAREGAEGVRGAFGEGIEVPIRWHIPDAPRFELDVPHMATGGVVTKPTLALIGEKGPEVVSPLSSLASRSQPVVVNVDARGSFFPDRRSMQRHADMITKPIIERLQDSRLAPIETVRP